MREPQTNSCFSVSFGWSPNQAVVRGCGQHVQVTSRNGEVLQFMLEDAIEVARICAKFTEECRATPVAPMLQLRRYFGDNRHGSAMAWVDILVDQSWQDPVSIGPFEFPSTTGNGQSLHVEASIRKVNLHHDAFEANSEGFYTEGEHFAP